MGGGGCDDNGPGEFPSQDCKRDFGDDNKEGKRQGMVVELGGRGAGGDKALNDKGVCAETEGYD